MCKIFLEGNKKVDELLVKYNNLLKYLKNLGSVAVAFSSGVDSTFLLYAAKNALGDNAIAITAALCSFPEKELEEAKEYCAKMGVRHYIVLADEFQIDGFAENPKNRCYLCKKEIFTQLIGEAKKHGINDVVEGSNLDDNGDYRPGLQAISELKIKSPLRDNGFTKQDIRDLSEHFDIPTWNKPSLACLSTRFPYGEMITKERLKMVENAEQYLFDMGFSQLRVRIHGDVARIELLPEEFSKMMIEETRKVVYEKLKAFGFSYIALDLLGYRTGSMNEKIIK